MITNQKISVLNTEYDLYYSPKGKYYYVYKTTPDGEKYPLEIKHKSTTEGA